MVIGIGVDIEEIKEFRKSISQKRFVSLLFTKREIAYCQKKKEPWISFAGKFCAKEAVVKAVFSKLKMKEIEIINQKNGKLVVFIQGKKMKKIFCSISHMKTHAMAFVIVD